MLNRVRLMLENESYAERDNSIFLRRIFRDELSRPEKTFIMSHEAYSGMSYLHSESIAKTFAKNLSIFLAGCKTKIIVYLRRQDVLMESLTSSQ